MTRNTRLYKASIINNKKTTSIIFRTLTIEELQLLISINNIHERNTLAGELSILKKQELGWQTIDQIGDYAIRYSTQVVEDADLFELTVRDVRDKVAKDSVLIAMTHILRLFPGQSITDLMKLTHLDIIELMCFAEIYGDKALFNVKGFKTSSPKKGMRLVNPTSEAGTLQDKMEELNKFTNV
jgi:hypothetical protein